MADIYDYLSNATPDYDVFLNVAPQEVLPEDMDKNQEIHHFDDGSHRTIALDDTPIPLLRLRWMKGITSANAGNIVDMFLSNSKANAHARSFPWRHPMDLYGYVAKFDSPLSREFRAELPNREAMAEMRLWIVGRLQTIVDTNSYEWTASGSGTNEYYCTKSGGADPSITQPTKCWIDATLVTSGNPGFLTVGQWGFGNSDVLGFNTLYARLSDGTDPDTKARSHIEID